MTPVSITINLILENFGGQLHSTISTEEAIVAIAAKFVSARRAGAALVRYPGDVPQSMQDAYWVQDLAIAQTSDAIAGWKVGRVFPPLSTEFGCDRLAGPIFKSSVQFAPQIARAVRDVNDVPQGLIYADGFGAAEAEFLLRIGTSPRADQKIFSNNNCNRVSIVLQLLRQCADLF